MKTDEDRALAAWFWRNVHYAHGQDGRMDLFDTGFEKTDWNREYWTGLFAHGFGLCGTTHAQWIPEMDALLGHCRSRSAGVKGHNAFEVFLKGGSYGEGRWVLLDHDLSTVIFDPEGKRMLSIEEIRNGKPELKNPDFKPERQRGWRLAGLYQKDAEKVYDDYNSVAYLAGYAGPPPMIQLRSGELLRRYLQPGLADGKSFVFWGQNYNTDSVPGPERSRAWVNQPEKMFGAKRDAGHIDGQVRFANAVSIYKPRFEDGTYREGIVEESANHVTFEFQTPYVIAATPPDDSAWGIYKPGGKNGLVISGKIDGLAFEISTDRGNTWQRSNGPDLTDFAKGHQQYWLKIGAGAKDLANRDLTITTVCQANVATIPQLREGKNQITVSNPGRAIVSAGPNLDQAMTHRIAGELKGPEITLKLGTPRGEKIVALHAASHNASGNPPPPDLAFAIEYSADNGASWKPIVTDWKVERRAPEPSPPDYWSQSFTYGSIDLESAIDGPVQVRFSNNRRKGYRRIEAHLEYEISNPTPVEVTFCWTQSGGFDFEFAKRRFPAKIDGENTAWEIEAGESVRTIWVEYRCP
ncbi:MAG: hypothetical protein HKN23_08995 [Verrucomicrobiales bacterium]|nr:hypothetical protein [Verrucomicrobiales bacterium]